MRLADRKMLAYSTACRFGSAGTDLIVACAWSGVTLAFTLSGQTALLFDAGAQSHRATFDFSDAYAC